MSARLFFGLVGPLLFACGPAEPEPERTPDWLLEDVEEQPEEPEPEVVAEPQLLVPGEAPLQPEPSEAEPSEAEPSEAEPSAGEYASRRVAATLAAMVGADFETAPDHRHPARWPLDLEAPFTVSFGRGSGRSGLDVITIDERGEARVSRYVRDRGQAFAWRVQVDPSALRDALEALAPTELKHRYIEPYTMDGAQWVFEVRQGSQRHVVYCSNLFAEGILAFAHAVDAWIPTTLDPDLGVGLPRRMRYDAALWDALSSTPADKVLGSEPRAYVR